MSEPIAHICNATVAVAFSGGRDSLALLHATVHAAAALGIQVVALHVHHGLLAEADVWLASAKALCARWRTRGLPVRLRWHQVDARPAAGDSIEAWARQQRYDALTRMAREEGASVVLLAHHRRDQAETVLLQALRGAGSKGLAGMPKCIVRDGLTWARPWLGRPREDIDAYVWRHRLRAIEDPSNQDARLARNRLRLLVWPALSEAFDNAEVTLCGVAARAQEADAALTELADIDLASATGAAGLDMRAIAGLSKARRGNALRTWIGRALGSAPASSLIQRLLEEVVPGRTSTWPLSERHVLKLHREHLRVVPKAPVRPGEPQGLDLSRPGLVPVPAWGGCFVVATATSGQGVPAAAAMQAELRPRSGGERFQLAPHGLARSLKKQFQFAGVGEWHRGGPLVWLEGRLAYVPGLGIDARWWGDDGAARVSWQWRTDIA